ncbi:MAG: hypothetical protein H6962_08370 [Chromatiaceae bacterium]|nr:hypothetical protein [Chromatiaceae bacterium]
MDRRQKVTGFKVPDNLDANTRRSRDPRTASRRSVGVPEANDELVEGGFTFCVLSIEEHRVGRVNVRRTAVDDKTQADTAASAGISTSERDESAQ